MNLRCFLFSMTEIKKKAHLTCSSFLMLHCIWSSSATEPGLIWPCKTLADSDNRSIFLDAIITLHPKIVTQTTLQDS